MNLNIVILLSLFVSIRSIENEMADLNLKATEKMDLDSAIEQISQLKSYIESTARDLNINFNFNGL